MQHPDPEERPCTPPPPSPASAPDDDDDDDDEYPLRISLRDDTSKSLLLFFLLDEALSVLVLQLLLAVVCISKHGVVSADV